MINWLTDYVSETGRSCGTTIRLPSYYMKLCIQFKKTSVNTKQSYCMWDILKSCVVIWRLLKTDVKANELRVILLINSFTLDLHVPLQAIFRIARAAFNQQPRTFNIAEILLVFTVCTVRSWNYLFSSGLHDKFTIILTSHVQSS